MPGLAAIVGAEQRAGDGAGPEPPRLVRPTGRQGPDKGDAGCLLALLVRRHADREGRCRQLRPGGAEVLGAVQLHAEVAEVERRIERAVATVLQEGAHRIAEEAEIARRLPAASLRSEEHTSELQSLMRIS